MSTPSTAPPPGKRWPTKNAVQRTRAWTGLLVVVAGDVAIALAAIWGVIKGTSGTAGSGNTPDVAILTSAFTAIGTMTTAYFGIKSMSNTAQSFGPNSGNPSWGNPNPGAATPGTTSPGGVSPGGVSPGNPDQGGASPGGADQGGASPGSGVQPPADPDHADPGAADPGTAEPAAGNVEGAGTDAAPPKPNPQHFVL